MHLDGQKAQLGTKHGVHCRLTMGLMIGTICLYSNFGCSGVKLKVIKAFTNSSVA